MIKNQIKHNFIIVTKKKEKEKTKTDNFNNAF